MDFTAGYDIHYGSMHVGSLCIEGYKGAISSRFIYSPENKGTVLGSLYGQEDMYLFNHSIPVEFTGEEAWDIDTFHHKFNERHTKNGTGLQMTCCGIYGKIQ